MRRLVTTNTTIIENYINCIEKLFYHDRIQDKLQAIDNNWDRLTPPIQESKLNYVDKMAKELLLNAEQKGRKLRTDAI